MAGFLPNSAGREADPDLSPDSLFRFTGRLKLAGLPGVFFALIAGPLLIDFFTEWTAFLVPTVRLLLLDLATEDSVLSGK
jgi:hypothetical protein